MRKEGMFSQIDQIETLILFTGSYHGYSIAAGKCIKGSPPSNRNIKPTLKTFTHSTLKTFIHGHL